MAKKGSKLKNAKSQIEKQPEIGKLSKLHSKFLLLFLTSYFNDT